MSATIRFENLTLGYDRHPAVHHLSGEIGPGSLLAVVGPNGAGKSTLAKGIVGLLRPQEGRISGVARDAIAYLPQQAQIDRSFPICVFDVVTTGLWQRRGMFGGVDEDDQERTSRALDAVGLEGFATRSIGSLSGGQLQRVLFARLLLQDAPVIVLDEPFTAIDTRTANDLLGLIQRWHQERRTVVAVLHDLEMVRQAFPTAMLLAREPVAWGATGDVLTPTNLLQARRHIEAFDDQARMCTRTADLAHRSSRAA